MPKVPERSRPDAGSRRSFLRCLPAARVRPLRADGGRSARRQGRAGLRRPARLHRLPRLRGRGARAARTTAVGHPHRARAGGGRAGDSGGGRAARVRWHPLPRSRRLRPRPRARPGSRSRSKGSRGRRSPTTSSPSPVVSPAWCRWARLRRATSPAKPRARTRSIERTMTRSREPRMRWSARRRALRTRRSVGRRAGRSVVSLSASACRTTERGARYGGYALLDHWQQGEFHHDLLVKLDAHGAPAFPAEHSGLHIPFGADSPRARCCLFARHAV